MASRRADLEQAARNHGVSLAQIADRRAKAPELTSASIVMRAQSYRRQIDAAFESAAQILVREPLAALGRQVQMSDAKLFANRSALFANDAESAMIACSLL
jgi:hypothetical protein